MKPTACSPAAVQWFARGFALGAAGASPGQRKGQPRLSAMVPHWRAGIRSGRFAASAFVGAYAAQVSGRKLHTVE